MLRNTLHFMAISVCLAHSALSAAASPATAPSGWQPDPKIVEQAEKRKGINYRESAIPPYTLPDPLLCADGTRITSAEQWEKKGRPETLEMFSRLVYGRTPPMPEGKFDVIATDPKLMDGKATLKRIRITSSAGGKSFAFEAAVIIPNGPGKFSAFLLINNRPLASADPSRKEKNDFWPAEDIISRGYATAVFMTNDVDPDKAGDEARAKGVRAVFTGPGKPGEDAWATIGAWASGASRVLDYLETDPAIDATKVAVIGHSRGGKTALWAAAQDTRFAIGISNDSGCGGAALSKRIFGETVATINKAFPYWFCDNFKKFDNKEAELPIDQHQLIALIAPRAVCVGSADGDLWADPRGEFLAMVHAAPIFALYGQRGFAEDEMPPLDAPITRDRMNYHIRRGTHNLTPVDWTCYMNFADGLWGRQ